VAQGLGAKALAVGRSIAFAPGQFRPGSRDSDLLIAHELAHVVQQSGGLGALQGAAPDSFEAEADHAAEVAVGGGVVDNFSAVQAAVQCGGDDDPPVATFVVETEIYAQPEEGRWIRGKISEVREPATTSEEGVLQVSGPPAPEGTSDDGWEYIVDFEADTGYTQLCLLSYNLHDAKVQQNPSAAGRGLGVEEEDPEFSTISGDNGDAEPLSSEPEEEHQDADQESEEQQRVEEDAPISELPPPPHFDPLPHPPSVSPPLLLSLDAPSFSIDMDPAEEAWYLQQTGRDMQSEIDTVNDALDHL
jgi:hypothetical protein